MGECTPHYISYSEYERLKQNGGSKRVTRQSSAQLGIYDIVHFTHSGGGQAPLGKYSTERRSLLSADAYPIQAIRQDDMLEGVARGAQTWALRPRRQG